MKYCNTVGFSLIKEGIITDLQFILDSKVLPVFQFADRDPSRLHSSHLAWSGDQLSLSSQNKDCHEHHSYPLYRMEVGGHVITEPYGAPDKRLNKCMLNERWELNNDSWPCGENTHTHSEASCHLSIQYAPSRALDLKSCTLEKRYSGESFIGIIIIIIINTCCSIIRFSSLLKDYSIISKPNIYLPDLMSHNFSTLLVLTKTKPLAYTQNSLIIKV